MDLITDRTAADAEAGNQKGTYNASDVNRVESAAALLSSRLQWMEDGLMVYAQEKGVSWQNDFGLPFEPMEAVLVTRTDWEISDWPTAAQMRRYLQNIVKLCVLLDVPTDELPETMAWLDFQEANAIEIALQRCDEAADALLTEKKSLIDQAASQQRRII